MTASESQIRTYIVGWINNVKTSDIALEEGEEGNLIEKGFIDSLGFLGLIGALEGEFGIEIDFEDFDPAQFTSLSGLVKATVNSYQAN